MRIGIIACNVLKNEIEFLTKDDEDFVKREYLEFALHEYPQEMKAKIIETVSTFKGEVDAILLGYAICNSLEGIESELDVPTVMLPGCDCIDTLLGPEEYANEKKKCTGTWFSSPGWAEQGINGLIKEFHLDTVEGVDPSFFLDMLFDSYQRSLFIDPGIGNTQYYMEKSKECADSLKLKHECRTCDLSRIKKSIKMVKEMASNISS